MPGRAKTQIRSFHQERPLEDYGHVLLRYGDALGMIAFSQITHGRLNDLTLEVDGRDGSLSWRQEEPNQLVVRRCGEPAQVYDRNPNADYIEPPGREACRLPAAHPEGFFEAFANIYRGAFDDMIAVRTGGPRVTDGSTYPTVHDGVEGVRFVEACQQSSGANGNWVKM